MARVIPINANGVTTAGGIVVDLNTGDTIGYRGFSISEAATTAAAAVVRVRQGSVTGDILDTIKIPASSSVGELYTEAIDCRGDLYLQIVSGAIEGNLRID